MPKFFNRAIRILLITNGLVLVASAMLGPIYALFVKQIGGDLLDASFAFAIFAFMGGVTTLVSGQYADKIKENELIIVLGYAIMGIGFLSYILVHSVRSLFVVQVILGLGEAIYLPAFDAVYSKHLDDHKSGREWGAWEAMDYFAGALGAVTGGFLVTLFGFNGLFLAMATLCLISATYIFFLKRSVL